MLSLQLGDIWFPIANGYIALSAKNPFQTPITIIVYNRFYDQRFEQS